MNQRKAGVVLSYLSMGIGSIISLLYTPIMLRLLGQSEYGLYQLASTTVSYLGLLSFGMGGAYIRYYSIYKVKDDKESIAKLNGMYITVFSIIGIIALVAGAILVLSIERLFEGSLTSSEIETARILMILMVFNLGISFPFSVFGAYISAKEEYIFLKIVQIVKSILNPFFVIPLLLLGYQSISLIVVSVLFNIVTDVIYVRYCIKKLNMCFCFKKFDVTLLREIFIFSSFIFMNEIVSQINWSVDKFLLGVYSGTTAVAVYSIASQLNSHYLTFSTAISGVFVPKVNQIVAKEDDNEELTQLFTKVGRVQFLVLALIMSGLVILGKAFIYMWAGEEYVEAYCMMLILVIPVTVPLIQNIGIEIQRAKNKHQFRSWLYLGIAISNVFISIPLCQLYGGIGCAIGTGISLIIGNGIIMNIYYHRVIRLNMIYFWIKIISMFQGLIVPIIVGIVIVTYVDLYNIINFVLVGCIYTGSYIVSMWKLGMNQFEKDLFIKPILRLISKYGH